MPGNPVDLTSFWKPKGFGSIPGGGPPGPVQKQPGESTTFTSPPVHSTPSPTLTTHTTGPPIGPTGGRVPLPTATQLPGPVATVAPPSAIIPPSPTQTGQRIVASNAPPGPAPAPTPAPSPPPPAPAANPPVGASSPYYGGGGGGGFVDTSGAYQQVGPNPSTDVYQGTPATPNPGTGYVPPPTPAPAAAAPSQPNLLEELLAGVENLFAQLFGGGSPTPPGLHAARMGPSTLGSSGGPYHQNADGWEYHRNLRGSHGSSLGESVYVIRRR